MLFLTTHGTDHDWSFWGRGFQADCYDDEDLARTALDSLLADGWVHCYDQYGMPVHPGEVGVVRDLTTTQHEYWYIDVTKNGVAKLAARLQSKDDFLLGAFYCESDLNRTIWNPTDGSTMYSFQWDVDPCQACDIECFIYKTLGCGYYRSFPCPRGHQTDDVFAQLLCPGVGPRHMPIDIVGNEKNQLVCQVGCENLEAVS